MINSFIGLQDTRQFTTSLVWLHLICDLNSLFLGVLKVDCQLVKSWMHALKLGASDAFMPQFSTIASFFIARFLNLSHMESHLCNHAFSQWPQLHTQTISYYCCSYFIFLWGKQGDPHFLLHHSLMSPDPLVENLLTAWQCGMLKSLQNSLIWIHGCKFIIMYTSCWKSSILVHYLTKEHQTVAARGARTLKQEDSCHQRI